MKNVLSLFVAALVLTGALVLPVAAAGPSTLNVIVDGQRRNTTSVGPRLYVNEAYMTSAAASVQATCPAGTYYIQFFPGSAGDFFVKANGSGVPGAATVSDGTGWLMNLADISPINQPIEGVNITAYAVQSNVVPNKVSYACFK